MHDARSGAPRAEAPAPDCRPAATRDAGSCDAPNSLERCYPGLSPQLLARTRQLWSARGLDLDAAWRAAARATPGFGPAPRPAEGAGSAAVDLVFLFDQGAIWVKAAHQAAARGAAAQTEGLDPAQWQGLAALTARLDEELAALRMLALAGLALPAMQVARPISEDVDTALALLVRRRLAARFAACADVEAATAFWRRHVAGGRAWRTLTEQLYRIGIDRSPDTEYGRLRQEILAALGTATHSSALGPAGRGPRARAGAEEGLHFATFRIHELCAYAQLVRPGLGGHLAAAAEGGDGLAPLAGPMCGIVADQIRSLARAASAHDGGDA